MIVNAIIEGYRQYINHRRDRRENMIISSAFAWTKGNFIESQIAETCKDQGFSYQRSKAGPTWDYLQFINDESKSLFLIKNAIYFNASSFANSKIPIPGKKQGNSRTYLQELSRINQHIDFSSRDKPSIGRQTKVEQLSLVYVAESEVKEQLELFQSEYKSFHILTYQLDYAHQITKIMHYLPNPGDNIAYPVEDLSHHITGAELTDEDRSVIAPERDEEILDPTAFDIGILEEELDKE